MKHTNIKQIIILATIAISCIPPLKAEQTQLKASIDSAAIMIGQQTRVHLDITTQQDKVLQLPVFQDTLTAGIEIINVDKIDTTHLDNNRMQIRQSILVTAFDSALHFIPPFKVIDGLDTIYSNPLALKVETMPIDETQNTLYDIKNIWNPIFKWNYILNWLIIPLVIILLIIAAYLIYKYIRKHKTTNTQPIPQEIIPPHERALIKLNKIKAEKIWHKGRTKEYYTQLTDVLRTYINERFHIDAMEMTTTELIHETKHIKEIKPIQNELKETLDIADLVKFAKYIPTPDDNEKALYNAYLTVETTKQQPPQENKQDEKNETTNNTNEITPKND